MSTSWEKVMDETSGKAYWWNPTTNQTTWEDPLTSSGNSMPPPLPPHMMKSRKPDIPTSSPLDTTSSNNNNNAASSRQSKVGGLVKSSSARFKNLMATTTTPNNLSLAASSQQPGGQQPKRKASLHQVIKSAMTSNDSSTSNSGDSIDLYLQQQSKLQNVPITDLISQASISGPSNVKRELQVTFDADTLKFTGIPDNWAEEAYKQFGVPLVTCPRSEVAGYRDRIPTVLCILRARFVELGGLTLDGVFRLAPDGQDVADVKYSINTGDALRSVQSTKDPHVVANLIKQFYRELKPTKILNPFSSSVVLELAGAAVDAGLVARRISELPEPNQSCFLWLLDLLADVAENSSVNRMTPTNLAIVLSPNLYDAGPMDPFEELVLSQKVAGLTSVCLKWRIDTRSRQ